MMYEDNIPKKICERKKVGMNQGSGFGINTSSESIYYKAVNEHYANYPTLLSKDLATATSYAKEFSLDVQDIEEVYNFTRYIELGYQRYSNRARLQLNGNLREDIKEAITTKNYKEKL